jgi:hypothetical protein
VHDGSEGGSDRKGFFDTEAMVVDFLKGMHAAEEVQRLHTAGVYTASSVDNGHRGEGHMPHIIVSNQ